MAEHPLVLAQVPAPPQPPVIIDAAPGQVIDLRGAAGPDAVLSIEGADLVVTRPEAPPIVLRDLVDAAAADPPPIVQLADAAIPAPELVGRVAPFTMVPVASLLQSYAPRGDEVLTAPRLDSLPEPALVTVATAHHDPAGLRPEPDIGGAALVQPPASAPPLAPAPPVGGTAPPSDSSLALLLADGAEPPLAPVILGTSGDDHVTIAAITTPVDLLDGRDTVDLSALATADVGDADFRGVERVDLRGGEANTLTLDVADVLDLSPTTDTFVVRGDAKDTIVPGGGWTPAGTQTDPAGEIGTFSVYRQSAGSATATLLVESQVEVA